MPTNLAPTCFSSADPSALSQIREPDCNLAIWQREPISDIAELLDPRPRDMRLSSSLDELAGKLPLAMDKHGYKAHTIRTQLIEDIVKLAGLYGDAMRIDRLDLRLEVVTTNSCRKFHADYVKARLITTYTGTGTQWLQAPDAQRIEQGNEPLDINTMSAGDVGLFKGKLATDAPAIHRSPPIEGTGEQRLLLVLNPPEAR